MDVDEQCSSFIWTCYQHEQVCMCVSVLTHFLVFFNIKKKGLILTMFDVMKGLDELKQSLISTTWDLEMTVLSAKEELSIRECELLRVNDVLNRTIKERDELQLKCRILQEQNHHQHLLLLENGTTISLAKASTSSGSSEESESNTSSISSAEQILIPEAVKELIGNKPLPEKGRLLQAVMEAGPLLETVLLAGPLPQWEHPPPHLNFIDIPLVSISINQKTKHKDTDQALIDSSLPTKYQKTQH